MCRGIMVPSRSFYSQSKGDLETCGIVAEYGDEVIVMNCFTARLVVVQ